MDDRNCELLFEYLRSILYDSDVKELDPAALDEPFQKLGMGLQYLSRAVQEMQAYSAALAKGNLSVPTPPRDNFLCENLKSIHANLNHLTWQAKQVAKGDYSQTVSYLGEFSEAFNSMTAQLRDREAALRKEAQNEKDHAAMIERNDQILQHKARVDVLTGISNRYHFMEEAQELLSAGTAFSFCYCDLDHLKYVNDHYGHLEGDRYLCAFVGAVRPHIRSLDIFARVGGDEFCLILPGCPKEQAEQKLARIQKEFAGQASTAYQQYFSYGIVYIKGEHSGMGINELVRTADQAMYLQKKEHKQKNHQYETR